MKVDFMKLLTSNTNAEKIWDIRSSFIQFLLLTILFSVSTNLKSQDYYKKHQLNTNLLSLINTNYSSATIGYEFRPIYNFGLEITYGHILGNGEYRWYKYSDNETEFAYSIINKLNSRGNILRLEPKYYISQSNTDSDNNGNSNLFLSIRYNYVEYSYTSTRLKIIDDFEDIARYNVNQKNHEIIPTIGIIRQLRNFFFEFSSGLGIRWLNVSNDYGTDLTELLKLWRETKIIDEQNRKRKKLKLNLNLKFGVCF